MRHPRPVFQALLVAALAGCHRPVASSVAALPAPATASEAAEKPALAFLTFRAVAMPPAGPARLSLLSLQAAPGRLKSAPETAPSGPDYLTVTLLDPQNRAVGPAAAVEHPLHQWVEAADERQQLYRRLVSVAEAEFFVRLPLPDAATQVRVEEFLAGVSVASTIFPLRP